jgi:hypothetical protein
MFYLSDALYLRNMQLGQSHFTALAVDQIIRIVSKNRFHYQRFSTYESRIIQIQKFKKAKKNSRKNFKFSIIYQYFKLNCSK